MFGSDGVDRRLYEMCVMAELKNALRSGDVSVSGSRQFRDFEDYLMPQPEFGERLVSKTLHVAAGASTAAYLEERIQTLKAALTQTDMLASAGQLPMPSSAGPPKDHTARRQRFEVGERDLNIVLSADDLAMTPHALIQFVCFATLTGQHDGCTASAKMADALRSSGSVRQLAHDVAGYLTWRG